jgi:hypothetical protein
MRNRTAVVCLAILALPLAGAVAGPTKEFHKVVAFDGSGRLSVSSHNGTIRVTTWNQPNVKIDARIEPDLESSYPEDVDLTNIRVSGSGSSVRIESDYSAVPSHAGSWFDFTFHSNLPLVHYTISMPATARLAIEDHNAKVYVTGLRNDLTVESHNGPVDVRDFDGGADIETHNGTVRIEFVRFAKASHFETHNGSFDVRMPAAARFDLNVDGHRNDPVSSDFALTRSRDEDASSYSTHVNGGGPELRFVTHNGSLRLGKL